MMQHLFSEFSGFFLLGPRRRHFSTLIHFLRQRHRNEEKISRQSEGIKRSQGVAESDKFRVEPHATATERQRERKKSGESSYGN